MPVCYCQLNVSDQIALFGALATSFGVIYALYAGHKQGEAIQQQLELQNKQLITQQFAEYTKRYQEIIVNFPENINESNFDFKNLKTANYNKTMRYMRLYFDLCFEEWLLNEQKLVDNLIWDVWEDGIKTAMSKTAFKQAWDLILDDTKYGKNFETFMSNIISND
jgi:hypothetical protein